MREIIQLRAGDPMPTLAPPQLRPCSTQQHAMQLGKDHLTIRASATQRTQVARRLLVPLTDLAV